MCNRIVTLSAIVAMFVSTGCSSAGRGESAPPLLLGVFEDDYGGRHTVTERMWSQHPANRFHIVRWVPEEQYLLARNDSANASSGGAWTRIDWLPLAGMPPWEWAFCFSAYNAPTPEAAAAVTVANRAEPRTGCNGYPFSRMRRVQDR